ncbi:hypothetical protein EC968_008867 [Mortierella alpina]|nr:hypothetical protein EC968_008867 [Mortierella alpina]
MTRSSESSSKLEDNAAEQMIALDQGRSSASEDFNDQDRLIDERLQQEEESADLVASSLGARWSSSPIRRDAPSTFNFPVLGPTTQTEPEHSTDRFGASLQSEAPSALLQETEQHSDQEAEALLGEGLSEDNSRTLTYPALPWGQRTRTRKAGSASMRLITSLINNTADTTDKARQQKSGQDSRSLRVQQKDDHGVAKRLRSSSITSSEGSLGLKSSTLSDEPEAPFEDAFSRTAKRTSKTSALKNEVYRGRLQRRNRTSSDDDSYDPSEATEEASRPRRGAQKQSGSRTSVKQGYPRRTLRKKADAAHTSTRGSEVSIHEHDSKLQSRPHRSGSEWFECVLIPKWEGGAEKLQAEHPIQEHSLACETAAPRGVAQLPETGKTYSERSKGVASKSVHTCVIDIPTERAIEDTAKISSSSSKKSVVPTPPAQPTTSNPAKVFHGWWIQAKPCREKVFGCDAWIGVHGNVLKPKAMVWHTSFIQEAIDPDTVMTLTGSLYYLRGSLDEERMRSHVPTQQPRNSLAQPTHMPDTTIHAAETLPVAKVSPKAPVKKHTKGGVGVVDLVGTSVGSEDELPTTETSTMSAYKNGMIIFGTLEESCPNESTTTLQDEETWSETTITHLQKDRQGQGFSTSEDEEENEAMFTASASAPSTRDSYNGFNSRVRAESHPPNSPFKSLSSISAASQSTVMDFVDQSEAIVGPEQIAEASYDSLGTDTFVNTGSLGALSNNESLQSGNTDCISQQRGA